MNAFEKKVKIETNSMHFYRNQSAFRVHINFTYNINFKQTLKEESYMNKTYDTLFSFGRGKV